MPIEVIRFACKPLMRAGRARKVRLSSGIQRVPRVARSAQPSGDMMRLVFIPIEKDGTTDLPPEIPLPSEAAEVLSATAGLYNLVGFVPPWICYLALDGETSVGTCGFKSAPQEGRVEIAYFTFPCYEGRGIATSMASGLLGMARKAAPEVVVAAQTLPDRNASHRILEKLGFRCVGPLEHPEDGTVLEWRLDG
ncbi:MAG: GNAT family N-acetyltransferase [Steroidobacteraceae bacterium]